MDTPRSLLAAACGLALAATATSAFAQTILPVSAQEIDHQAVHVSQYVDSESPSAQSPSPPSAPPSATPPAPRPQQKPAKPKTNPCATSHKGVFYNNSFDYLEDPSYRGCCLGDSLKRICVNPCTCSKLDIGGQFRLRYHHERGMGQQAGVNRFQSTNNDFLLERLRLYANYEANDCVRFFVEGIFADVTAEDDYVLRGFDRNYGDLLNAFVDLKLTDSITARVGRQELLYGAQRLVSPLDWANTRRTFEGVNLIYREGDWSIDGFFTHFVPVQFQAFDEADYDQPFYGAYATYSGMKNATVDLYYLGYENQTPGAGINNDFSLHTVGGRINGSHCGWLYEVEGGGQYGRQSGLGLDHSAQYATLGIGRKFDSHCWKPTLWFYYDYATGNTPAGDFDRFNQLFPLAHKYFGFIDAVQRSNIESPNVLLTMNPTKKTKLLLWYWHFMSNQPNDVVPAIGGTPAQNGGSSHLGDEIDVILTYNINARANLLFGYSHFWIGNKINRPANDADFFYTQFQVDF